MDDNTPKPCDVFTGFQKGNTIFVIIPDQLREVLGWPSDAPTSIFLYGLDGPAADRRLVIGITPPVAPAPKTLVQ